MKLGICVAYLVRPENRQLLELHLHKLRELTPPPYTIYGGVTGSDSWLRERLEAEPRVQLVELPETELTGTPQHSLYLGRLIDEAVADGVTHVATLHVDSFPIAADWSRTLGSRLTGENVLATVSIAGILDLYSACLFFRSELWREQRPRLRLSEADLQLSEYRDFLEAYPHDECETGAGLVFCVYRQGLSFIRLEETSADRRHFGAIYGDIVFHLAGAHTYPALSRTQRLILSELVANGFINAKGMLKRFVPEATRAKTKAASIAGEDAAKRALVDRARRELLQDPEAYIGRLLAG